MLTNDQILKIARRAASIAADVLDFNFSENTPDKGNRYTVTLVNVPDAEEDGYFMTTGNEIQINTATITPFPGEGDEDLRLAMKVMYITYHEMRHFYQKRVVEALTVNEMFGGSIITLPESKKKAQLWREELTDTSTDAENAELEEDANAFADYLLARYPGFVEMSGGNKRKLAGMKKKYDKKEVPSPPATPNTTSVPNPPSTT